MRSLVPRASGVLLACLVHAGCATSRSAAPSDTVDAVHGTRCVSRADAAHKREMTWDEYYTDVRERAWRRNALIIWITPPEVHKRPRQPSDATACAR